MIEFSWPYFPNRLFFGGSHDSPFDDAEDAVDCQAHAEQDAKRIGTCNDAYDHDDAKDVYKRQPERSLISFSPDGVLISNLSM